MSRGNASSLPPDPHLDPKNARDAKTRDRGRHLTLRAPSPAMESSHFVKQNSRNGVVQRNVEVKT